MESLMDQYSSGLIPDFFSMFLLIYLYAYFVIFRRWGPKHRSEASCCLISLAHGAPVVFMALHGITPTNSKTTPSFFSSPNTNFQKLVLECSISYFLMDLLHYILFYPRDVLFIFHHLATLYVLTTCRFLVGHGAAAILVLLLFAEATSACQNVWSLAGFRRNDVKMAAELYDFLSPCFYAIYSVFRGVLGPIFVYEMGVFYARSEEENLIPKWVWVSWMVVIVTAILVSILWVANHWIDWYRKRSYKKYKKAR